MAAKYNQDFLTFAGDDVFPIFTVYDSAGVIVDISTVSDIQWYAKKTAEDTVSAASASKLGGTIAFVTSGVDGKFQVTLTKVVTAALDGMYQHIARIIDALGNVTTVTVGTMKVGVRPTWNYDPQSVATSDLMKVRLWVGDVNPNDQQLQDAEILYFISQKFTVIGAAADCARAIANRYSRKVDVTNPGDLRTNYSAQAKAYMEVAKQLDTQAKQRGGGIIPFAGGISISGKIATQQDTDRVQPSFNIGMDDNFIPVAAGPNQTPTLPSQNSKGGL